MATKATEIDIEKAKAEGKPAPETAEAGNPPNSVPTSEVVTPVAVVQTPVLQTAVVGVKPAEAVVLQTTPATVEAVPAAPETCNGSRRAMPKRAAE